VSFLQEQSPEIKLKWHQTNKQTNKTKETCPHTRKKKKKKAKYEFKEKANIIVFIGNDKV
jgi:hypothetical protein